MPFRSGDGPNSIAGTESPPHRQAWGPTRMTEGCSAYGEPERRNKLLGLVKHTAQPLTATTKESET